MRGPFRGLPPARRKAAADLLRAAKQRVVHASTEPGCIFCSEQLHRLDTHFFWYLNELYFEPSAIERMQRSHGFCHRHTRHLLARGGPGTIGRIYLWMLPPFLDVLRSTESTALKGDAQGSPRGRGQAPALHAALRSPRGSGQVPALHAALRPTRLCQGCETEKEAPGPLLMDLRGTLEDPEVREALRGGPTICLEHFLALAPSLDWGQLADMLEVVLGPLGRATLERGNLRDRTELVRGRDVDARLRPPDPKAENDQTHIVGAAEDSVPDPTSWSPTLEGLHQLLAKPGCPICHVRHRGLRDYFAWLSREIVTAPPHQWSDALWLCRTHTWDFLTLADPVAADKLVGAIIDYWHARLSELAADLRRKPPIHWWDRLTTIPGHVRRIATERGVGQMRIWNVWTHLGPAMGDAMAPPDRVLAGLRTRQLRRGECPACHHLATVASRTCELLARSLADPTTLDRYQRSTGVCYRDLALALRFCRATEQAQSLARLARVRLEVLEWELQEALRKDAWDVRYEPKGPEQSAWRRAVEHVSGSHLTDSALLGLG